MQSRYQSFIEALLNTLIGYVVALTSQLLIFPLFGIKGSFTENLLIGGYFTLISIVRSYAIRRWFNAKLRNAAIYISERVYHCQH